jgi:hypothetical protein
MIANSLRNKFALVLGLMTFCLLPQANAKILNLVSEGQYAISNDLLQGILAKEICSCVFVSQVGGPGASIATRTEKCLAKSQLPLSPALISTLLSRHVDANTKSLEIDPALVGSVFSLFQGGKAIARYEGPKVGCRLLTERELHK